MIEIQLYNLFLTHFLHRLATKLRVLAKLYFTNGIIENIAEGMRMEVIGGVLGKLLKEIVDTKRIDALDPSDGGGSDEDMLMDAE